MNLRRKLENQLKKKKQEIQTLETEKQEIDAKMREAKAYMQGIEDTLKMLPRESIDVVGSAEQSIRPSSTVGKTLQILKSEGKSLHVKVILKRMDKACTKNTLAALSGQIGQYVRQGRVFTRPAPNTFGLLEWGDQEHKEKDGGEESPAADNIPSDFGSIRSVK